jgi:two-component system OmpR family response regulator
VKLEAAVTPTTSPPREPRKKALVLDDDPKMACLLSRILEEEGYAVDQCARGKDALQLAELGGHTIVLLDRMAPGGDGLTVWAALVLTRADRVRWPTWCG